MNWKRILLALGLMVIVVIGACGWWVYRKLQPQEIAVRNETSEVIAVGGTLDYCGVIFVSPGGTATYRDGTFLCKKPGLEIESPVFGTIECEWDTARSGQPVVITDTSVSCHSGAIPTPFSTPISPPRRLPTPTPGH